MRRGVGSRGQGGPLLTNHLQIQDLDLELELLKRKREMIEKQHEQIMCNNQVYTRPRPFDFGHDPQESFQGLNRFNPDPVPGYSRYNDNQQSGGYGSGGLLGKRPAGDPQPWQSLHTPKRPSVPQGRNKKKFNSGPSPKMNQPRHEPFVQPLNQTRPFFQSLPQPLFQSQPQPLFQNPPISRPRRPNPPAKSSKPTFPSQRFNSNPRNTEPASKDFRPTKVTKPKQAFAKKFPTKFETEKIFGKSLQEEAEAKDELYILSEDRVPTQQLAGRLELALGQIMKDIKTKYENKEPYCSVFQQGFMQRKLKQSIRERLRSAMMGKYVGRTPSIVEQYRKVFPLPTDFEIMEIALDSHNSTAGKQFNVKIEKAGNAHKYVKHNLSRLVTYVLDDMFAKIQTLYKEESDSTHDICKKMVTADLNKSTNDNKEILTNPDENNTKNDSLDGSKEPESDSAKVEVPEKTEAKEEAPDNESQLSNELSESQNGREPVDERRSDRFYQRAFKGCYKSDDDLASKLEELLTMFLRRKLPYILPRYKNTIHKLLDIHGKYTVTRDTIIQNAQDMLKAENKFDAIITEITPKPIDNSMTPYMVKVVGRPFLPKRKVMQTFLNEFKPSSVKKHRTLPLLFVSFTKKENYDKIVALKETQIGTTTIYIKVNEKSMNKSEGALNASGKISDSIDSMADTTINSDLDEQINDLLSSIRKEEEEANGDENKPIDTEVNKNGDVIAKVKTEEIEIDDKDKDEVSKTEETELLEDKAEDKEIAEDSKIEENDKVEDPKAEETEAEENGKVEESKAEENDNVAESNAEENDKVEESKAEDNDIVEELKDKNKDKVEELKSDAKESGRSTPTRASSRLATSTPSSIRTRRASRLMQ